MESITEFFKEEKDPLFRKGEVKGRKEGLEEGLKEGLKEGQEKVVINLIEKLGLPDEQAAEIANVSVVFVQKIRKKLKK